jgi:RimJ/RimL family protein N-acetyltransferase
MATLIQKWAIPYVGVREMDCVAFEGNIGSVRVFEKNGFKRTGLLKDNQVVRGELKSEHVLEWRYNPESE